MTRSSEAGANPPGTAAPDATEYHLLAREFLCVLERYERETDRVSADFKGCCGSDDENRQEQRSGDPVQAKGREHTPVPAVIAAVGVLVAQAIEAQHDLLRRMRCEAPVLIVETRVPALVKPVRRILETCVFGGRSNCSDLRLGRMSSLKAARVGILDCDGTDGSVKQKIGDGFIADALQIRVPLVGIAPDPEKHLPRDLVRAADHRLAILEFNHTAVGLTIEAVLGKRPTKRLDDDLLSKLVVADLPVALRNVASPDDAIDAIARILSRSVDTFEDVPSLETAFGFDEAKIWGLDLVSDLRRYKQGLLEWDRIDNRSLLISGDPGVGKTAFARSLAKSARVPLLATSVAIWNSETYLSGTLRAIRDVFAKARSAAPCILFIDEFDGISDRSNIRGEYAQYWTQIVNCLLEQLGDVDGRQGVIVVAATNHPERIDPAIKRSGRLDREIIIRRPDTPALVEIFRHHLGMRTFPEASLISLALAARGRTGADVQAYVRRACGAARRAGREVDHVDVAREIRQGRRPLSAATKRRIAIHEAGHAVVSRALGAGVIVDISLHDTGGELRLEPSLDGSTDLAGLEAILATLLAGRTAEEIATGAACVGAGLGPGSDLAEANRIAGDIEFRFGLGAFGPIHIEASARDVLLVPGGRDAVLTRLRKAQETARGTLQRYWSDTEVIASALLETEYLSGVEIDRLVHLRDGDPTARDRCPSTKEDFS